MLARYLTAIVDGLTLLYLNEGWQSEWGGALELWNADATRWS